MDGLGSLDSFIFEDLRFDRAAGCLYRTNGSGVAEPLVELGPRALAVLALLIERQGRLVSKDAIFAAVWPGIAVGDGNLAVQISALRRVLDDGRTRGSCIQTIPGRGYRFVAPVTRGDAVAAPAARGSGNGSVPFATDDQPKPRSTESGTDVVLPTPVARRSYRLWRAIIAAVIGSLCLAAAIGTGVNSRWFSRENVLAPRLSIVVLPFTNLSNDPAQQYFVDGVTENLTTDLSRIADSFVISRNTAFTYRNKPVNAKQIGHELGVRYVLEGSIQRSGNRVRVNTQLIDAETDAHLWAEPFEHDIGDLFALQNEITSRIAIALNFALVDAEAARQTNNLDALDFILRGRAAQFKPISPDRYAEQISMFEHALTADPGSVEAQSRLADVLVSRVLDFGSGTEEADLRRAEELATRAVTASPRSDVAHMANAEVLRIRRRCGEAIREYETVLALNRNMVNAWATIGRCRIYIGPVEEAILPQEQAIRLSPFDPNIAIWCFRIGEAHLLQSQLDDAILWFEKALSANEGLGYVHAYLASAYALKGETDHAAAELAEARKLGLSWPSLARLRANTRYETPTIRAVAEATFYAGLRKAGMPEE